MTQAMPMEDAPRAPRPIEGLDARSLVLTPEARAFVDDLVREFRPSLRALLRARAERQAAIDEGELSLDFLEETRSIRDLDWRVAPLPLDLLDRRVEITAPVDRKMMIHALNSGANVFMADFEDSLSPTWTAVVEGQKNLFEAVRGTLAWHDDAGRHLALAPERAVLMVRPRGLHLDEKHWLVDEQPAPAALVDFGLYFFHNAAALLDRGTGPYFYLPKLESRNEARWWSHVFAAAEQKLLRLPSHVIKATVLIETLPAAFEMDEILYALKDFVVGLNCGRRDYIFSTIKTLRADPAHVMPDRALITMTQPCMRAYTKLLIKTCHRRGAFAMGGMAAQIPIKNDAARNEAALAKVRADKAREAQDGHDGTWVAHPALVPVAREIFDAHLGKRKNQLQVLRDDVRVTAQDLLAVPQGARTEAGLVHAVIIAVRYLATWLDGNGCVPLYGLMEDAATAEISRAQVWQWLRHHVGVTAQDGASYALTAERFRAVVDEAMAQIEAELGKDAVAGSRFHEAKELFVELSTAERFADFLTVPAYERLEEGGTP